MSIRHTRQCLPNYVLKQNFRVCFALCVDALIVDVSGELDRLRDQDEEHKRYEDRMVAI